MLHFEKVNVIHDIPRQSVVRLIFYTALFVYAYIQQTSSNNIIGMNFCYNGTTKDNRLNVNILRSVFAQSELECILLCLDEVCCRSANFRKKTIDDHDNCELLHPSILQFGKQLSADPNYDYLQLLRPNRSFTCNCSSCELNGDCDGHARLYHNTGAHDCSFTLERNLCSNSAVFPNKSTLNYIKSKGAPTMTAITACLWVNLSTDAKNPSFVSYATKNSFNEFLIHVYDAKLVITLGRTARFYGKVLPNLRGVWNAFCVTWSNTEGRYELYKNGIIHDSGSDFKKGSKIAGGGLWVLGQDQDSYEGGFNVMQMVVGEITDVNIWDRVLSKQDIEKFSSKCDSSLVGNVKSWNDFKRGIGGYVKIKNNTSCCKI